MPTNGSMSYEMRRAVRQEARMDEALDALKAAVLKAPEAEKAALKKGLLACMYTEGPQKGLVHIDQDSFNAFLDELAESI